MTEILEHLKSGPREGVTYPQSVLYCGNCSMPIEVRIFAEHRHLCNNLKLIIYSFVFSTVNIIQIMKNVKHGWKKICQMNFQK